VGDIKRGRHIKRRWTDRGIRAHVLPNAATKQRYLLGHITDTHLHIPTYILASKRGALKRYGFGGGVARAVDGRATHE